MSREIKFRAWDNKNKYILDSAYGDWISFDGVAYTQASRTYNTPNIEVEAAKDYILMQYTGLKDKNGKEIYEGDILNNVKAVENPWVQIVEYSNDASFVRKDISKDDDSVWGFYGWDEVGKDVEIIGNIYENPELLNDS